MSLVHSQTDDPTLSHIQGDSSSAKKHVVIMGAGPAGLTAAYELVVRQQMGVTVLEKDPRYVGGISRTVEQNGYRFDIGGHRFFSKTVMYGNTTRHEKGRREGGCGGKEIVASFELESQFPRLIEVCVEEPRNVAHERRDPSIGGARRREFEREVHPHRHI